MIGKFFAKRDEFGQTGPTAEDLQIFCEKKSIAIVGNSESLCSKNLGSNIDDHDVVVRFNRAMPRRNAKVTHGRRTDIWSAAMSNPDGNEPFIAN